MNQIPVQPSQLVVAGAAAGQWVRGIPTPGVTGIPAVDGVATCRNLLADSPPTILEAYQIYSYSLAIGAVAQGAPFGSAPTFELELALLVNDRPAYVVSQTLASVLVAAGAAVGNAMFTSDLVNPLALGARDRLGLRLGVMCSLAAGTQLGVAVGAQIDQTGNGLIAVESGLLYDTLPLPASRRL